MDVFTLSRNWFNFCFENPELIRPNHTAIYFFAIEHCNRLGWKDKFGFPTTMAMEALGIKSYNTYIDSFNDLIKWDFIKLIEKSRNQYSANIIALSKKCKALDKALDKALIKHGTKQVKSTSESIDSIDIQDNNNTNKQINKNTLLSEIEISDVPDCEKEYFEITRKFIALFESNLAELKIKSTDLSKAKYQNWVDPIRLILTNDKRTKEDLREIYSFLQKDDFWRKNIRSTDKLRNKFETLLVNIRSPKQKIKEIDTNLNTDMAERVKMKLIKESNGAI